MKAAVLWVTTTLFSISAYAIDKADIEQIANSNISKEQVEKVLGNPTHISQKDNRSMWQYKKDDYGIEIIWNDSKSKMERLSFLSKEDNNTNWDVNLLDGLTMNTSGLKDAIKVLGTPNDLLIQPYAQKLRYKYKDHVFVLEFQKGVLKRYELLHA